MVSVMNIMWYDTWWILKPVIWIPSVFLLSHMNIVCAYWFNTLSLVITLLLCLLFCVLFLVNTYEGTHDIHSLILGRSITGLQAFVPGAAYKQWILLIYPHIYKNVTKKYHWVETTSDLFSNHYHSKYCYTYTKTIVREIMLLVSTVQKVLKQTCDNKK